MTYSKTQTSELPCVHKVIQILITEKYSNISIHDKAPKYVGMLSSDIKKCV
jgi:hypothetical protein